MDKWVYNCLELKTLWEKEKLLVMSNFSFSHNVLKSYLLGMRQNEYLWSKGIKTSRDFVTKIGEQEGNMMALYRSTFLYITPAIMLSIKKIHCRSVGTALDLKIQGCGFDPWAGQHNNFLTVFRIRL